MGWIARVGCLLEQSVEVERPREHRQPAVGSTRPLFFGAIPIKLHPVTIGIAQIECFADAVIRRAFERNPRFDETAQSVSEFRSRRIKNRKVIKAGCAWRRRRSTRTFPSVQANVMVIVTGGKKRCLRAVALREFEAQRIAVKRECPFQIGYLQVDVANPDLRMKRARTRVQFHNFL
jgi:hypothetical protein